MHIKPLEKLLRSLLDLIDKKTGNTYQTHTIRYWETQFKQIKPKILELARRRYYSTMNDIHNYQVNKIST